MKSFKQALNQLKNHLQHSLLLGVLGALLLYTVRHIPYLGAFVLAFGALYLQDLARTLAETNAWPRNFQIIKGNLFAYVGTSVVLVPTFVLGGSAMGLLQSPQGLLLVMPLALLLFILSIYFYFILSHSLRLHLETKLSLPKAIDTVGLSSIRNFKIYLPLSFYFGLLMMLSGMTWGAGYVISLPLLFYVGHYSYLELQRQDLTGHAPR